MWKLEDRSSSRLLFLLLWDGCSFRRLSKANWQWFWFVLCHWLWLGQLWSWQTFCWGTTVLGWQLLPERSRMGRLEKLSCHLAQFNPHYIQEDTKVSLSPASLVAQSHVDFNKTFAGKTSIMFIETGWMCTLKFKDVWKNEYDHWQRAKNNWELK